MVRRVQRETRYITPRYCAAAFKPLLVPVVALLAQRLPIGLVPKQGLIATVRRYVIDHSSWHDVATLLMVSTQWMPLQERCPRLLPPAAIPALR
jgi:hypothetical protein